MAEWSIATVLKTVRLKGLMGSNPILSSSFESQSVINGGFDAIFS